MIDWMNPSKEMLAGQEAGRQDSQNEIDALCSEVEELEATLEKAKEMLTDEQLIQLEE